MPALRRVAERYDAVVFFYKVSDLAVPDFFRTENDISEFDHIVALPGNGAVHDRDPSLIKLFLERSLKVLSGLYHEFEMISIIRFGAQRDSSE